MTNQPYTKGEMAKTGLAMIFGGGFLCLFIITAVIGVPMIILGCLMLLLAPFHNPKIKK